MNNYILQILEDIMAIDSPSGYTKNVITYCEKEAHQLGFQTKRTNKGNLEIGKDADIVVVDMNKVDTIENEKLHSKQPLTAFAGRKIKGWPIKTFLRGQLVVDNNKICQDKACGKWIK